MLLRSYPTKSPDAARLRSVFGRLVERPVSFANNGRLRRTVPHSYQHNSLLNEISWGRSTRQARPGQGPAAGMHQRRPNPSDATVQASIPGRVTEGQPAAIQTLAAGTVPSSKRPAARVMGRDTSVPKSRNPSSMSRARHGIIASNPPRQGTHSPGITK